MEESFEHNKLCPFSYLSSTHLSTWKGVAISSRNWTVNLDSEIMFFLFLFQPIKYALPQIAFIDLEESRQDFAFPFDLQSFAIITFIEQRCISFKLWTEQHHWFSI
jgi:hypothetical protein